MEPSQNCTLAPARPPASPSRWLLLVLILCFVLGVLISWIAVEHHSFLAQQNQAKAMTTAALLASGRADDLGTLLADQRTLLICLNGANPASIAYNHALHRGYLFCPNLPPLPAGQTYHIVAVNSSPHTVLDFAATPGQSVYAFHVEAEANAMRQFQLRDGSLMASGEVQLGVAK